MWGYCVGREINSTYSLRTYINNYIEMEIIDIFLFRASFRVSWRILDGIFYYFPVVALQPAILV